MLCLLAFAAVAAAQSSSSSASAPSPSAGLTITPSSTNISVSDSLAVSITAGGNGNVVLTSGGYTKQVALDTASVNVSLPAGVLQVGTTTLNATFSPSSGGSAINASATIAVTAAQNLTVSAQTIGNLSLTGYPLAALPFSGGLLVSSSSNNATNASGLSIYKGSSPTQLTFDCFQSTSVNGSNSVFGVAQTPNATGFVATIEDYGLALLSYEDTTTNCSAVPIQVSQGSLQSEQGAFDVSVTPDGAYAFVANEYGVVSNSSTGQGIEGNVGVVALEYNGTLSGGRLLGQIGIGGSAIAGVTVSHDGKYVYSTAEIVANGTTVSGSSNSIIAHGGCLQAQGGRPQTYGLLSVIDVSRAVASPDSSAIVTTVAAGCSPVRIVESADGEVVWVTARGDDRVLAYSRASLLSDPDNALIGYGSSGGVAPVGLVLFAGGQLLAVANSNRFANPGTAGNVTILSALPTSPTLLATVNASLFPRGIYVGPDNSTLYLSDYLSSQVQIISTSIQA